MRLLEIILAVANVLTLARLAIPRLRAMRGMGLVAPITALIAVIQVLVEGPRWQILPAYALTAVFVLTWLLGIVVAGHERVGRLVAGLGIGLGVFVLAVSIALPTALPVFHFPRPTGPYAVGSMTYHWVDTSRPELFTADPNDHRELMAQVWYPARDDPSEPRVPYMEDAGATTTAMARIVHFPGFFFAYFKYVTTNAVSHAPVADEKSRYPVLVFLSGLGGFRASNSYQIEELVSHGYVVVGLDQPGGSAAVRFPDGRLVSVLPRDQIQALIQQSTSPKQDAPALNGQVLENGIIPYFAQDVSFTIDRLIELNASDPNGRLAGRLDLQRVGVFGVSLGAIVAGEATHMDARIKASLMMDAAMPADVVQAGLRQACMWITRPAGDMRLERSRSGGWPEASITETLTTMRAVFDTHASGSAYYLDAPGMFHVNFTDAPFWSPLTSQLGLTGPVDGKRMFDIVNAYSLAFFDKYLKGQREPLLDGPATQFPEVHLERR
jgi:predicted dienelactone hydrolase